MRSVLISQQPSRLAILKPAATACLALAITALSAVAAGEDSIADAGQSGSIQGRIHYAADAERPWRYARYYVKDQKHGWLGEAVVALEGIPAADSKKSEEVIHTMDQVDFQFEPEVLAIRAGHTVRFLNSDDSLHNVMTADGEKPFNENVMKGDELLQKFERAGGVLKPIRLGCVFHGGMRAWIYVFDHPWFAVTKEDGRFEFKDVPEGEYTLSVAHPSGRLRWSKPVKVEAGENKPLEVVLSPDDLIGAKEKAN